MTLYTAGQKIRASELNALPQMVYMTGDQTSTTAYTTSYVNATGMSFAAEITSRYLAELFLYYNAPAARDIIVAWTVPTGATAQWGAAGVESGAASGGVGQMNGQSVAVTGVHAFAGSDSIDMFAAPVASFLIGGTAGTVQLKFAQFSAGGTTTLRAGSAMRITKLV